MPNYTSLEWGEGCWNSWIWYRTETTTSSLRSKANRKKKTNQYSTEMSIISRNIQECKQHTGEISGTMVYHWLYKEAVIVRCKDPITARGFTWKNSCASQFTLHYACIWSFNLMKRQTRVKSTQQLHFNAQVRFRTWPVIQETDNYLHMRSFVYLSYIQHVSKATLVLFYFYFSLVYFLLPL